MPQLQVFAACEKVIISQDENNPTLIALLSDITAEMEVVGELEKTALLPMRWSVFSLWHKQTGDDGKTFEQRLTLVPPSGGKSAIKDTETAFSFKGNTHRITLHLPGLPIAAPAGEWAVQCFVREQGSEWPSQPVATYYLNIHIKVRTSAPTSQPS